jgi:type I restriction enzyme S subunit
MKGELTPKSSEWRECLLGEVTKIRTGKLDANASSADGIYPFFTCARDPLRISSFSYDTECVLLAGNGNFDVNYYSGKFDAYQRTYILEARDRAELSIPFLYRFMQGHSRKLLEQSIGGVIKYIKIGFLTEAKFLLPQMEEQKMIVSKVDELMDLCDQLELALIERNELTKKIAGSLASEVAA